MTASDRSRPRIAARLLVAAFWLATIAGPGTASGSNLGFLKDAPITRFRGADLEMFQSNLNTALEQNADGDTRRWENPDTGSSGEVVIVGSFAHDGERCRHVRISNRARGYAEAITDAVFCKQADGQWKMLPQPKRPPAGK
jgi:surface antigen